MTTAFRAFPPRRAEETRRGATRGKRVYYVRSMYRKIKERRAAGKGGRRSARTHAMAVSGLVSIHRTHTHGFLLPPVSYTHLTLPTILLV